MRAMRKTAAGQSPPTGCQICGSAVVLFLSLAVFHVLRADRAASSAFFKNGTKYYERIDLVRSVRRMREDDGMQINNFFAFLIISVQQPHLHKVLSSLLQP